MQRTKSKGRIYTIIKRNFTILLGALSVAACTPDPDGERATQSGVAEISHEAEQGSASAQYQLGVLYANGDNLTQSDEDAVQWFRRAAEQGHTLAQ